MKGLRRGKDLYLLVGIIVTFGILMSGNLVKAQEPEPEDPDLFFSATLLTGQSTGNQGFSSVGNFGIGGIGVTSIGNRTLSAGLSMSSNQSGIWWVFLIGTGGRTFADLSVGVAPFSGPNATIDIGSGVSFGWAFGSISVLNPGIDDPITWTMSVNGAG